MPVNKEELFKKLSDAVVDMNEDEAVDLSKEIVDKKVDAYEAVEKGLSDGMERAGKLFEEEEYFIPELLLCSDAMYAGLDILKGHIRSSEEGEKRKVVIGVVEGDTHDIGKNLVKIMLETSGFDVFDLGRDIPPAAFVEKAKEVNADIIALATLMTTTMDGMSAVVEILKEQNIKDNYKVIIGGGPISQSFADKIGADGYAVNAADAVRLSKRLLAAAG
ncbi:corrinoid protein [Sporomusa acidovorans]|uniref:Methionine synthase n=1 Tax=Sporomusa acidovorans (strain ATCC 49682 / DSM 3132 / Mol) TaxID=1123286 RepID=A0ABZ3IZ42_SPOA4|nr:corrinoid protein [Sporomusa acidovorans]OZC16871.1 methionine synthase [Sporomusa acidovorans DSM 3132]SDF24799.1 methyltransferase cognate corrinoid proteins [Sporomusa acidovorans]